MYVMEEEKDCGRISGGYYGAVTVPGEEYFIIQQPERQAALSAA